MRKRYADQAVDKRYYSVWFHYNKPSSVPSKGIYKVSVHFRERCYIVDHVVCDITIQEWIRKSQPHFVMKGRVRADHFIFDEATSTIYLHRAQSFE